MQNTFKPSQMKEFDTLDPIYVVDNLKEELKIETQKVSNLQTQIVKLTQELE